MTSSFIFLLSFQFVLFGIRLLWIFMNQLVRFLGNRYLTLKPSEFELACRNIRFLDPAEITLIREAFDGKKSSLNAEQIIMLNNFRKPRPKYTRMPIYLSARSHPKKYPRRMRQNDRNENSDSTSCFLNCLAAFVCLCD